MSAENLEGIIDGSFGKSGKFKVRFPAGGLVSVEPGHRLVLRFKKFAHQPKESRTLMQ
mgnify:FL=1